MRDYELTFVVRPDLDDNGTKAAVGRVESLITSRGGELTNVQNWGKRRLAYPIGRHGEGIYTVYRLRMEPEHAAELEHELNLDEQVLRFIMLSLTPVELEALRNPPPPVSVQRRREPPPAEPPPPEAVPAEAAAAGTTPAEATPAEGSPEGAVSAEPVPEAEAEETAPPAAEQAAEPLAEEPTGVPETEPAEPSAEA